MPFTAAELLNIQNSVIDFNIKDVTNQTVQARPLYDALMKAPKTFPGGKDYITMRVRGDLDAVEMTGYSHDDEQSYTNPSTIKEAKATWKEVGSGTQVTYTELKKYGVSVETNKSTTTHSDAEMVALVDIVKEKDFELVEGSKRSLAEMFWRDGTQDAKAIPGIMSFIVDAPTTGTRFGIDASVETYWRNRASLLIDSSTASNQNLVNTLQKEFRQLRRYGTPKHMAFAGSDLMDAFEKELRSKGNYTQEGWSKGGTIDAGMADIAFKGIQIVYEPLLDDLSKAKYMYILDMAAIKLWQMQNEWMSRHTPERPPEKYVLYNAITCTGGMCANQLNTSGVYSIA